MGAADSSKLVVYFYHDVHLKSHTVMWLATDYMIHYKCQEGVCTFLSFCPELLRDSLRLLSNKYQVHILPILKIDLNC
jgi:hypothetical protein